MEKKGRIPREKIIAINTRFVYFLEKEKVFRARRKILNCGGRDICMESTVNPLVVEKSIKRVQKIWNSNNPKLIKILKKHGVKVLFR